MDAARFDFWTRRRFGFAAGGLAATLLGLAGIADLQAAKNKRKKRKKRCRKLGKACHKGGKRKCCGDLHCDVPDIDPSAQTRCCKSVGKPCVDNLDCCGALCCGPEGVCQDICYSDRALKANFGSIDPADMLQRVSDLPIATWNYIGDDPAVRHIGPMAQDFVAAFGVGADDRFIHLGDGQGVALAAIQGLAAQVEALREANARLAARVTQLEAAGQT